jgi:hypothetical protein
VKITFSSDGALFDFSRAVEDRDAIIQNSMINIGTLAGSDKVYPDKGTSLFSSAVRGRLVNGNAAAHASNFAAVDTLFFERKYLDPTCPDLLTKVSLKPATFDGRQLTVNAAFQFDDGTTVGSINTTL